MRIFFDGVDFSSRSGPNSFALRLARQLALMGHELADSSDYDVALVFIEATSALRPDRPYIQRLDGFWMKPTDFYAHRNDGIIRTCQHAAGVIWQSEFDRDMCIRRLCTPRTARAWKNSTVIRNGVPIVPRERYAQLFSQIRAEHDEVYVCSANWHPQKRLAANIETFRKIRRDPRRSCLVVLGAHPDVLVKSSPDDRIFYAGSITHDECMGVYSNADWMIHMAWLDHCPNTVIEALSVGTPVICTPAGGTVELLMDPTGGKNHRGLTVHEPLHDMSLVDYDNPPDISTLIAKLDKLPESWPAFDRSDLDIAVCAARYVEILESAL